MKPIFSVIIPSHNEEFYIGKCISSIRSAEEKLKMDVEIVVVLNRCDDRTEEIAKSMGAIIVNEDEKNISKIRNSGVEGSSGEYIVTIDSDSIMTENCLWEIYENLKSDKFIGGGVNIKFDRYSLPIWINDKMFRVITKVNGLYAGMFWTKRTYFDAVGGFDVNSPVAEDMKFAKKLKAFGKKKGMKYGCLHDSHIITSTRKFDTFGDWLYLKMMFLDFRVVIASLKNELPEEFIDKYWYEYEHKKLD